MVSGPGPIQTREVSERSASGVALSADASAPDLCSLNHVCLAAWSYQPLATILAVLFSHRGFLSPISAIHESYYQPSELRLYLPIGISAHDCGFWLLPLLLPLHTIKAHLCSGFTSPGRASLCELYPLRTRLRMPPIIFYHSSSLVI